MVCVSSFGQIFSDITHTLLSSPETLHTWIYTCTITLAGKQTIQTHVYEYST